MRAVLSFCLATAVAPNAYAQALKVSGQLGVLGEWELSATLSRQPAAVKRQFSGPLTLKHVGICSQDGPEEGEQTRREPLPIRALPVTLNDVVPANQVVSRLNGPIGSPRNNSPADLVWCDLRLRRARVTPQVVSNRRSSRLKRR